jgi:prophage regulatory protein
MSELDLLRLPQVLALVPVGRTTLYELIARGQFPRPSKCGPRINVWARGAVETFVRKTIGSSSPQHALADVRPRPARGAARARAEPSPKGRWDTAAGRVMFSGSQNDERRDCVQQRGVLNQHDIYTRITTREKYARATIGATQ